MSAGELRQREVKTLYDQPTAPPFAGPWRVSQRDRDGRIMSWVRSECQNNEFGVTWYHYHQFCPQANAYTHGGGYGSWTSCDRDGSAWRAYFGEASA